MTTIKHKGMTFTSYKDFCQLYNLNPSHYESMKLFRLYIEKFLKI